MLLRPVPTFSLRSQALHLSLKARLHGNSMLWVFLRTTSDTLDCARPIVIFKKHVESNRLFCIFGQLVEKVSSVAEGNTSKAPMIV